MLTSRRTHLRTWPHLHTSGSRPKEQIKSAMFEPALLIVQVPKMMEDYLRAVRVTEGREQRARKKKKKSNRLYDDGPLQK